jgi:Zn-dependent M28 family amino/carboxypeptidase
VDSPGAHDNATGTAGLIELARVLGEFPPVRTIRLLLCNEEHYPWTSVAAAQTCRDRGDNLIAVLNCDGWGARTQEEIDADVKTHGILYTKPAGKALADLLVELNGDLGLGLRQVVRRRDRPGDDDGSFVKAGYEAAVFNGGGGAGEYPYYHRETDTPDKVDVESVRLLAVVTLAAVLHLDEAGLP